MCAPLRGADSLVNAFGDRLSGNFRENVISARPGTGLPSCRNRRRCKPPQQGPSKTHPRLPNNRTGWWRIRRTHRCCCHNFPRCSMGSVAGRWSRSTPHIHRSTEFPWRCSNPRFRSSTHHVAVNLSDGGRSASRTCSVILGAPSRNSALAPAGVGVLRVAVADAPSGYLP